MRQLSVLTLVFALFLSIPPVAAQVFWSEIFSGEGVATLNWKNGGSNLGLADCTMTNASAAGYQDVDLPVFAAPTASSGYFYFDSDNNGQVAHDVTLTNAGNPAACSGKTGIRLRFFTQYIFFNPEGTTAQIGISTDSVNFTYKTLFAGLPSNLTYHDWVEVDIPEAENSPKLWLRFRWIGQYEYHWKVDDLTLSYHSNPDSCETAVDISPYFGQTPDVAQITGLFDNSDATVSATDPEVSCWSEAGPGGTDILNNTLWFTFTGDGGVYDIQTVPCNATNYVGEAQDNKGDTQMLVYAGENCSDLTPVKCNDDLFLTGQPDFRAGVMLETMPGQTYYMLIDGFENQGLVASGEFCIQVIQKPSVACSAGQVGSFALTAGGYLCAGENLFDILTLNPASFVLPTVGPQSGLAWCFTDSIVPPGVWPGTITGVAGTPFSRKVEAPSLLNNNQTLDYGTYFLTPVVLGGGVLTNPGALPYVFNINPDSGCYFIGQSVPLILLPPLDPLTAGIQVTDEILPTGKNGAIALTVNGGAGAELNDPALYQFKWSSGETTQNLNGLVAGIYTVTVSDASGCVAPLILTATVAAKTVDTTDPAIVHSLLLNPNPTPDAVLLQLVLATSADVRVEAIDMSGRVLLTHHAGSVQTLVLPLDLAAQAAGTYIVRVIIGEEVALRRVVRF